VLFAAQFSKPTANRAARNTCRRGNSSHATTARHLRLAGCKQPTRTLIQVWGKRLKASADSLFVDHPDKLVL
jgi:hypothetical protein